MKVLCIGFFDRGNFGDQLFAWLYTKCFPEFTIASIETLTVNIMKQHDTVLLAGGDILNDYFMAKLVNLLEMSNFSGTVHALSSGIPYSEKPTNLKTMMSIFDSVLVRSQRDYTWCTSVYDKVEYHPDVSIFTQELLDNQIVDVSTLLPWGKRKKIIMTVAQPFYESSNDKTRFLSSMCDIIKTLINKENGHVYFIPFNTYTSSTKECDYYLQDLLMDALDEDIKEHVTNVKRDFSMEEMFAIFKSMDLGVHMRYHAHMFSIITGLSFVSLGKTPKTINLLRDVGLPTEYSWSHNNATDSHYFAYGKVPESRGQHQPLFEKYISKYTLQKYKSHVYETIAKSQSKTRTRPIHTSVLNVVKYLRNKCPLLDYSDDAWVQRILTEKGTIGKMIDSYEIQQVDSGFLASLILYYLLGAPFPEYHYGLSQKIIGKDFMASRELQWIHNDYMAKQQRLSSTMVSQSDILQKQVLSSQGQPCDINMNLSYVNANDFNGLHRSGWPFVMSSLKHLDSPTSNIIFDNYVDRTFHWCHDIYSHVGLIPYKTPWIGVIHHTMDQTYSDYNTTRLLENPTFIESLKVCKGIIVLSEYLRAQLSKALPAIPIVSIKHPTDLSIMHRFDYHSFSENPAVVQVGAWLRDNYGIYALSPNETWMKKKVLRGKNMNHHFCPPDMRIEIDKSVLSMSSPHDTHLDISQYTNKFISGMLKHLHEQYLSVQELSTLSNEEYDLLFTNHIVFLNLVDASAVNTVIECIARHTPILINRHPAVVEYLGEDYPLFYDSMAQANRLVCDMTRIKEAHDYLKQMYKGELKCDHFVYRLTKFVSSVISTSSTE